MVSRQDLPRRPSTAKGDLGAITNEFRRHGIGPLMMDEVREIAYLLVPKYNAAIYSEIGNWRHGFDDLVQDVAADSLLGEQQAAYLIETADSIDEFRRLLTFQVKRRLARRRTRTVIDNLLGRARPILDEPPFRRSERHLQSTYLLDGELREERAATFRELQTASAAIRDVPQTTSPTRDRAPTVYSTSDLVAVLVRVGEMLPNAFTIGEVDRILRLTLPQFLPGVLDLDSYLEDDTDDGDVASGSSGIAVAQELRRLLNREQLLILASKVAGLPDIVIADQLDVSRRTVGNRKQVVYSILEDLLGPLIDSERLKCLDALGPSLRNASSSMGKNV
jgi:hypothetical protein